MIKLCVTTTAALVLSMALAAAAGPFEGSWSGEVSGVARAGGTMSGACAGSVTATVTDNRVQGQMQIGRSTFGWGGGIGADGAFTGRAGTQAMTGKFAGGSFQGSYESPGNCGTYRISLKHS